MDNSNDDRSTRTGADRSVEEPAIRDAPAALPPLSPTTTETATFGMGCFWGPDARFGAMEGIVRTRVGYAGGTTPDPSYGALGNHTEVVQIEYDPDQYSYDDLLDVFWTSHNWRSQSVKRQYRSVILSHDDEQHAAAKRSRETVEDRTGQSAVTTVEPLETFTLAESYHQKYELRSTPIVGDELDDLYGEAFVDSTVVARLNGFVAGHGDRNQRLAWLAALDLPQGAILELERRL